MGGKSCSSTSPEASGIDLDAQRKAEEAKQKQLAAEQAQKHAASVPGMLEGIFGVVDKNKDRVLSLSLSCAGSQRGLLTRR